MWSLDVTFTWFEFVLDTMTKYDQQNNNNKTREVGLHQTKQCLRRKWSAWWKVSPQDGESFWKLETDDLDLSSDFHCCLTLVHEDLIPVLIDVAPHASCSLLHSAAGYVGTFVPRFPCWALASSFCTDWHFKFSWFVWDVFYNVHIDCLPEVTLAFIVAFLLWVPLFIL